MRVTIFLAILFEICSIFPFSDRTESIQTKKRILKKWRIRAKSSHSPHNRERQWNQPTHSWERRRSSSNPLHPWIPRALVLIVPPNPWFGLLRLLHRCVWPPLLRRLWFASVSDWLHLFLHRWSLDCGDRCDFWNRREGFHYGARLLLGTFAFIDRIKLGHKWTTSLLIKEVLRGSQLNQFIWSSSLSKVVEFADDGGRRVYWLVIHYVST